MVESTQGESSELVSSLGQEPLPVTITSGEIVTILPGRTEEGTGHLMHSSIIEVSPEEGG